MSASRPLRTRRNLRFLGWIMAILASVVGLAVLALVLIVLFLSDPDRATPVLRHQIEQYGGHQTRLQSGWIDLGWSPVLRLRDLHVDTVGSAGVLDTRFNVFSLLFGGRLARHVAVEDAAYTVQLTGEEGRGLPAFLDHVRAVDGRAINLVVRRPNRDPAALVIHDASGDLVTGDFSLNGSGGEADLVMTGRAAGLSLRDFRGQLDLSGRNFAEFAALLSLTAPDTPPFRMSGDLVRDGRAWRFEPFTGAVGDSDLAGSMVADFSGRRPRLVADLHSERLDLDDLGVAIGAPSSVDGGEENPAQRAANTAYQGDARYIPDAYLDFTRMRGADAQVHFTADTVLTGRIPLSAMEAEIVLEQGVLTFEPMAFDATRGGRLTIFATLDATVDPAQTDIEGRLDSFNLDIVAGGRLLRGEALSRFSLAMTGSGLRAAFASADGQINLWAAPGARIRHMAVEGSDLDIGEVFLLMLEEDAGEEEYLPVTCAGAQFNVADGIARPHPALLDTRDSLLRMTGQVSLRNETLDLRIEADAKDVSWGNLLGDVSIVGTLRDPELSVDATESLLQGGLAVLLGSIAGPLAAVPFTELGFGQDAPCGPLMAETRG
ncbi:AsmA family protein [Maricaulis sp. CAU 1757]